MPEETGHKRCQKNQTQQAIEHLTRAARLYLDLGAYSTAALTALYAAEVARNASIELPEEAITLTARAAGELSVTSRDIYQKRASFGRQPILPSTDTRENGG